MSDGGHRYSFGAPSKGWPTFGPDGRIVREAEPDDLDLFIEEQSDEFHRLLDGHARRIADEIVRELFTPCLWCGSADHPSFECDADLTTLVTELRGLNTIGE